MQFLSDSPLLAGAHTLEGPAVLAATHVWTWGELHRAALTLSRQLGDASAVCNLCNSRAAFLVTWLAALRRRVPLVLPPSGGQADLVGMLKAQGGRPVVVVDESPTGPTAWHGHAETIICRPEFSPDDNTSAADLGWQPAWDELAVTLYTSGSTGSPQAQPKTLRQLATGAQVLGARLDEGIEGGLASLKRIVCSVPPQHMFGVETSVMLPLVHNIAVFEGRPLLPADVEAAFARSDGPTIWIATPLHLRSLAQAETQLEHCRVVVASTMPLSASLAQHGERLVGAPILEIYGSTETGVLAMRRSAQDSHWRPVKGVVLQSSDRATIARGRHFASPLTLLDQIELGADGRFVLLGRQADLIKIAGRRASLAGSNLLLQDLPGLQDGVFHLPGSGHPTERLCLVYAGPPLERAATDRWLRERLDPVFLPRAYLRVERLPRDANGKLMRPELEQLVERRHGAARAEPAPWHFVVPLDHPCLPGHFPGRPIVPGVLALDQVLNHLETRHGARVKRLQQIKFVAALQAGEATQLSAERRGDIVDFSLSTRRGAVTILVLSGSAELDAPEAAR